MNNDALISKMAEGFYQNAIENKLVTLYQEDLKFLSWNLKKNQDFLMFLTSPFVDEKEKYLALDKTFADLLAPEVTIFAKMLIKNKIIKNIDEVSEIFNTLAYRDQNVLEGVIYTPFELDKNQVQKISEAYEKILNKKCVFEVSIDKTLILGLKVLIDGTMYELNASSRLEDMKQDLLNNYLNNKKENNNTTNTNNNNKEREEEN